MEPTSEINTNNRGSFFRELVVFAGITLLVILPIRFFVAQPFLVSGSSMESTFLDGEYLIVDQISYRFSDPERGDVVIFRYPKDPSKFFIKRIIGLPGEEVILSGNEVYIKSGDEVTRIQEEYVTKHLESNSRTVLEDDEYFVMGDNRLASADSRTWGPLKKNHLVGRAYLRLLPINKIDHLPGKIE